MIRCWPSLAQNLISTTEINPWQLHQANSMEFTVNDFILIVLYIIELIINYCFYYHKEPSKAKI